jgi:beta-phosphoglucomutase-like phosphatase (HAD superfamily)
MPRRRAVIFDMDGVLVLSAPAHWVAWRDVALEHGVDLTNHPEAELRAAGAAAVVPALADLGAEELLGA